MIERSPNEPLVEQLQSEEFDICYLMLCCFPKTAGSSLLMRSVYVPDWLTSPKLTLMDKKCFSTLPV